MPRTRNTTGGNERMAVIETKLSNIQEDVTELKDSHRQFINAANKTYATKDELRNVKNELKDHTGGSKDWIKWTVVICLTIISIILSVVR